MVVFLVHLVCFVHSINQTRRTLVRTCTRPTFVLGAELRAHVTMSRCETVSRGFRTARPLNPWSYSGSR